MGATKELYVKKVRRYCVFMAVLVFLFATPSANEVNNPSFGFYINQSSFTSTVGLPDVNRAITQAFTSLNDVASWPRRVQFLGFTESTACDGSNKVYVVQDCSTNPTADCYREADVTSCADGSKHVILRKTAALTNAGADWMMWSGAYANTTPGANWNTRIEIGQALLRALALDVGARAPMGKCLTGGLIGASNLQSTMSELHDRYVYWRNQWCEPEIESLTKVGMPAFALPGGHTRSVVWRYTIPSPTGVWNGPSNWAGGTANRGGMGFLGAASGFIGTRWPFLIAVKALPDHSTHALRTDLLNPPTSYFYELANPSPSVTSLYRPQVVHDPVRNNWYLFAIRTGDQNRISYWTADWWFTSWTFMGHVKGGPHCIGSNGYTTDVVTYKNFSAAYDSTTDAIVVAAILNKETQPCGGGGGHLAFVAPLNQVYATTLPAWDPVETNWENGNGFGLETSGPIGVACGRDCIYMWTDNTDQRSLNGFLGRIGNCSKHGGPILGCNVLAYYPAVIGGASDYSPGLGNISNAQSTPGVSRFRAIVVGTDYNLYSNTWTEHTSLNLRWGWTWWTGVSLYNPSTSKTLVPVFGPSLSLREANAAAGTPEAYDLLIGGFEY